MKTLRSIMAGAFALALLSPLSFAADTHAKCCEKAKAEGKECDHKCCVEAKKAGKECEKCGAKKDGAKKDGAAATPATPAKPATPATPAAK